MFIELRFRLTAVSGELVEPAPHKSDSGIRIIRHPAFRGNARRKELWSWRGNSRRNQNRGLTTLTAGTTIIQILKPLSVLEVLVRDTGPANSIAVLVVSPCPGDLAALKAMLQNMSDDCSGARSRCTLKAVSTIASAVHVLQQTPTGVVLCDSELLAGSWT
jgi:hypothetical protein